MTYGTRYLPQNLEQWRPQKTILRYFPYNLNVRCRQNALIKDDGKNREITYGLPS